MRAIACGFIHKINYQKLIELIAKQNPTHLIMRTIIPEVFKWAIKNKIRTLAVFAASITTTTWRQKFRNYFLAKLFNNKQIEWVGTYGITSSLLFKEIWVKPDKIIPWGFLIESNPGSLSPKEIPVASKVETILPRLVNTKQGSWRYLRSRSQVKRAEYISPLKNVRYRRRRVLLPASRTVAN